MKTLLLMRHGRAEKFSDYQSDIFRELLRSGIEETRIIGNKVRANGFTPDIIISSKARRAEETAKVMASCLHADAESIVVDYRIFEAFETELLEIIMELPDELSSVLIVGHNPTLSQLSFRLFSGSTLEFPPSAVVSLSFDTKTWQSIKAVPSRLNYYLYPNGCTSGSV